MSYFCTPGKLASEQSLTAEKPASFPVSAQLDVELCSEASAKLRAFTNARKFDARW